jgi:hypothetical protein
MGILDATDPAQANPYGLTDQDRQQMLYSTLGQIGGLLMAAGQKQMPAQRAQYLGQLGQVGGNMQSDIYKMAQAKLMTSQFGAKQQELKDLESIRGRMGDAAGFRQAYGFDPTGLTPQLAQQIIQQKTVNELTNPGAKELQRLQAEKARRDLQMPVTKEIGNDLYEFKDGAWQKTITGSPKGGMENQSNQIITNALKDPTQVGTPDYFTAFNHVYGPKQVNAFNPETRQMEYQWVRPPVPEGIPMPGWRPQGTPGQPTPGVAPMGLPGAPSQAVAPVLGTQTMPPPGGSTPAMISRPPQEEKFTEEQNKAASFARRMVTSHQTIDPLDMTQASRPGAVEQIVGGKLGDNYVGFLRDADRQKYEQAKRNWVTANLRKESGAVIGMDEMMQEITKYFPMPGEGPEVIEQKRKAREDATMGMLGAAGPAAKRDGLNFKLYQPSLPDRIKTMPAEEVLSLYEQYTADPSSLDSKAKMALLARLKLLNGDR